jgi:protein Mpv17
MYPQETTRSLTGLGSQENTIIVAHTHQRSFFFTIVERSPSSSWNDWIGNRMRSISLRSRLHLSPGSFSCRVWNTTEFCAHRICSPSFQSPFCLRRRNHQHMWRNHLFVVYERLVSRYPVATASVTSGILWGSGDIAAQYLESRTNATKLSHSHSSSTAFSSNTVAAATIIDWRRVAVQSFYASVLWAPCAHYWYRYLDRWAHQAAAAVVANQNRLLARKGAVLFSKVAMEAALLHPIALFVYFVSIGAMKGESTRDISARLQRDFVPAVALDVALWTPLDVVNFMFVPVRHQLLVVNCGCFLESVGLSYIHQNGLNIAKVGEAIFRPQPPPHVAKKFNAGFQRSS